MRSNLCFVVIILGVELLFVWCFDLILGGVAGVITGEGFRWGVRVGVVGCWGMIDIWGLVV